MPGSLVRLATLASCPGPSELLLPLPFLGRWGPGTTSPRLGRWGHLYHGQHPPADEGRSSHTRLVSGVRRLQSPSECTEETEGGRSPDPRPGAGDLAFRLLGLPETLAFPPLPVEDRARGAELDGVDLKTPTPALRRGGEVGGEGWRAFCLGEPPAA